MDWNKRDRNVIWHPFSHQWQETPCINIIRGEGIYLYDDTGKAYMDAVSSWWVNLHGHAHPYMTEKIHEQLQQLEHVIFAGFTHPKAVLLAEELLKILPGNQARVFYSDNGSTAVEVAIKMTMQYWWNQGQHKYTFIAFENSYHGDTFGAMAVGAPSPFNTPFGAPAFNVIHIPTPNQENLASLLDKISDIASEYNVAGFIFEPLVQGSGGMLMYEAEHLEVLINHCRQLHIITIADEVMTGFGRTGAMFACDHLETAPDIFCLSKGLTGGYLPMGITTCTEEIYRAFLEKDIYKTFYHGHSYTGNPLSCAAALASLDILKSEGYIEEIVRIVYKHQAFRIRLEQHSKVSNARQCGTILAFDIRTEEHTSYFNKNRDFFYREFIRRGVLLRPLGNTIYILPPYCITNDQLDIIYGAIEEVLDLL